MEIIVTTASELANLIQNTIRKALNEQSTNSHQNLNQYEYLTIDEAATFLKIPKASLYQLTSKREIPYVKRSKRNFFKVTDLIAWQEEGRKKTRSEIEKELGKNNRRR